MPASHESSDAQSFMPPFATRDWVENGVTIGNRALKQIAESREEISRASGLPDSAWPEKLDGKPALATLLHRGMTRDPEFIRRCRVAVEGKKQKSPFLFFENAMKRLAMEGRSALGVSGGEKMSLSEEIEKLLRSDQDGVACQMVFILLAEGYPMFDDDILPPFLFKDGLAPVHPMMRELRLRRHAREGYSRGESEALADWSEAMNDAIFRLSPRSPSVKSVRIAAGGLRKALAAGSAYEAARSQAAPMGDESGGVLDACRRLEKIAPKMGAVDLQKKSAHVITEVSKLSARRFQVNDLRRIKDDLAETRTAMERACEEMEQADTLLREGGFARRHEADSLLSDGVKRAGDKLAQLDGILKYAADLKSGGEGVPAAEIERAAAAVIAAMFSDGDEEPRRSGGTGFRAEDSDGTDGAAAAANFDAFDELLVEHVVAGEFADAANVAHVVCKAAPRQPLMLTEDQIGFIDRSQMELRDGKVQYIGRFRSELRDGKIQYTGRLQPGEEDNNDPVDMLESLATGVETEVDGAVISPAVGLLLFTASLSCAMTTGDSAAERVMHAVSVDKIFNDAIWPLKRAVADGRKNGMFFSASAGGEGGGSAPLVSFKAMRDSVLEAVHDMRGMKFNFTLGQRVVQQLSRKELGELEDDVRENRISSMERFVHDHGNHKNADRLIEHAVQRVPSNSERLDGRARKQLIEAVERIAERCRTYLESATNPQSDSTSNWLRQQRKELLKCCEQGASAVDDFAVRHAGDLAGSAVKRCRERLEEIKKLAQEPGV